MSKVGNYFESEKKQKREMLQKFWDERVVKFNEKSINGLRDLMIQIHLPNDPLSNNDITKLFDDIVKQKINFEKFFEILQCYSLSLVHFIYEHESLFDQKHEIKAEDIADIKQYMSDKKMSAVISLGNAEDNSLITLASEGNKLSDVFFFFFVGKIFTCMLIFKMIEEKIISENDLNKPAQLDEKIIEALPEKIQERLKEVTLLQLITRKSGIGYCRDKYHEDIEHRVKNNLPQITSINELLPFIEKETGKNLNYTDGEMLLVGFAIERAYEGKYGKHLGFNDILQKYIIDKVGMSRFSNMMPKNTEQHQVKYNLADTIITPNLIGGPAGSGMWMTVEDLAKFGQWVYDEYSSSNSRFRMFLENYAGRSFYYPESKLFAYIHMNPSASAFFSIFLNTGTFVVTLSNQRDMAADLALMVIDKNFRKLEQLSIWG